MPGKLENDILLNDEPIPDVVKAIIRYSDRPNFWSQEVNKYSESFTLDLSLIRGEVVSTHTDDHLGLHKRSTQALEKVAPAVQQVAKDLHRIEDHVKPNEVRVREATAAAERAHIIEERRRQRAVRLQSIEENNHQSPEA